MKPPPIVTNTATIADSLVTVILVATIAFGVSSVISGSPIIKNKFPRDSIWIDRIVFFCVRDYNLVFCFKKLFNFSVTWVEIVSAQHVSRSICFLQGEARTDIIILFTMMSTIIIFSVPLYYIVIIFIFARCRCMMSQISERYHL